MTIHFELSTEPLHIDSLNNSMLDNNCGGYVSFEGRVRTHNNGQHVSHLEYESFESLASNEFVKIANIALQRFGVNHIKCVHRTGTVGLGEVAVWIGVLAKHRQPAFDACSFIISELKDRVPIWKKEVYLSGDAKWVSDCAGCVPKSKNENQFYIRQQNLREVGDAGQKRLKNARVLVVGAGGLGCPALQYLAGAGVGCIGIIDDDTVELSNLHRQTLYRYDDCGKPKALMAANRMCEYNPFILVQPLVKRISTDNIVQVISEYDLILDCTDNFATKFLLNDAAVLHSKPLIRASIYKFEGSLETFIPGTNEPCLRCLWTEIPSQECVESCAESGVIGAGVGILGSWQAMEAIKYFLSMPIDSRMTTLDFTTNSMSHFRWQKNDNCAVCSKNPAIRGFRAMKAINIDLHNQHASSVL